MAADRPVECLDLDDLLDQAELLLGTPPAIRDVGLLGAAVARPQTTLSGADAYPDVWSKAAALLLSIVKNHALADGNKRLGWLATAVFSTSTASMSHRRATTTSSRWWWTWPLESSPSPEVAERLADDRCPG